MVISHSSKVRCWPFWMKKGPSSNTELQSFTVYMLLADQQKLLTRHPKACTLGCQNKLQGCELSPSSQRPPIGLQSERTESLNTHLVPETFSYFTLLRTPPLHLLAPDKCWRAHAPILFSPQGPHAISPGITRLIPKWVLKQHSHLECCANPHP